MRGRWGELIHSFSRPYAQGYPQLFHKSRTTYPQLGRYPVELLLLFPGLGLTQFSVFWRHGEVTL